MPKVAKENAKYDDYGPVESWHDEVDGHAIDVCFEDYHDD